jgi:SAM-dependent methyltransferase
MPPEPTRFHAAARHYLRGRPAYAPGLIRRVAQLCRLGSADRVLDLGCGPGQLALAFAPLAGAVVGIDPEPEMLRAAREAAARAGLPVQFREGSSRDLGPDLGAFRLAVIGRAFHWMDREETLRRLDQIIEPGGAVALFGDSHPQVPDNRWRGAFEGLIDRYAAGDVARAARRAPGWLRHETVLLDSPFPYLERAAVIERRRTPLGWFVDRALSLSSIAQGPMGSRAEEVGREVREALAPYAPEGLVTEVVESEALVAWRDPPWDDAAPGRGR